MKIGFNLPHMGQIANSENISYAARFGEENGFDSLWVIDRILWPSKPQTPYPPSPDGSWPKIYQNVIDPISTLTYVAGLTKKIKLATGIIDMLYQNPLILAKRLVSLDNLSKGRLMLGLGIGHSKDEFQASGVFFKNRGERADEFLKILNKIWFDDIVIHNGKYYSIPESVIGPKPYQQKIPIYLGSFSLKGLARIIEFNSNGWLSMPQIDMELFKKGRQYLLDEARRHGRDPHSLEFPILFVPDVTKNDLGTKRKLGNGSIEEIAHDIQNLEKLGVSHINLVFDFSTHSQDLKKRLDYANQIKKAIIPQISSISRNNF